MSTPEIHPSYRQTNTVSKAKVCMALDVRRQFPAETWEAMRLWAEDVTYDADLPHWVLENEAWRGPVGCRFHFVGEYVLRRLLPMIACKSGTLLYPAYSIVVEYRRGMDLFKHYDQNRWSELACVILLDLDGTRSWPAYYRDGECFDMREGDAYLMSGHEIPHWREPLEGDRAVTLILRYTTDHAKRFAGRPQEWGSERAERGRRILDRYEVCR